MLFRRPVSTSRNFTGESHASLGARVMTYTTYAGLAVLAAGLLLMTPGVLTMTREGMRGRRITTFEALRYRNFRWFWINGIAQGMAQCMQFLVLGWLILEITDSAYQLGMVIFSYGMTNIAFSMLGGIMADRIDRLKLLILTRLAVITPILVLAVLTVTGQVEIWHLYIIALILGTVQALNQPVRIAFVADLVDRKDMMNAVSLHALVNQTGQILGPAIGGGVIELAGLGATLFLDAGLYLLGVIFLLLIRGLEPRPPSGGTTVLSDLVTGFKFIMSTPVLYTVIGMAIAFAFFGVSHRQVMPAIMKEALGVGAGGTGLMLLSAGVGSIVGSLILASLGEFQHKAKLLLASIALFCVLLALWGLSPWYWVSWAIFFFVGVASFGLFWPLATTLVQLNVPAELRGRVLSYLQLAPAVHHLGALPLAAAAGSLGWAAAIAAGAVMCFGVSLWLGVLRPPLRRLAA